MTVVNDNTVGGTTGAGVAGAFTWGGISVSGTGSINLQNIVIKYTSEAINFSGSSALVQGSIQNTTIAIDSQSGSFGFRGSLINAQMGIESCDWGGTCGVDAAYTYWGSSAGPTPSTGPALACGAVTVSPWLTSNSGNATSTSSSVFGIGNCDQSQTPNVQLDSAASAFDNGIASEQIDCSDGFQDACQAIQTAESCLSAATNLAESQSPFTVPAAEGDVASAGSSYLASSESKVFSTIGSVLGRVGDILGVIGIFQALANAYNQCDP
jgi:hypothetical protein